MRNQILQRWNLGAAAGIVLLTPAAALAHTGVGPAAGLGHGLLHPLVGVDHLLAMLGVGLWAGQRGGRALWLAPSVFLAVLAIGGALGMAGITLPWVEPGIVASVLVVGVLVAAAVPMPLGLGVGLMGLFALVHGHAHGAEAPVDASGAAYAAGFLAASALLVGAGIALARGLERGGRPAIVRACGAAVALGGAMLCIA